MSDSPHPSPNHPEHDPSYLSLPNAQTENGVINSVSSAVRLLTPPRPSRQERPDDLKSFKVSLNDPIRKVLPAVLKKYKINNDSWQDYVMFVCYGPTSTPL
jgi:bZIP factor